MSFTLYITSKASRELNRLPRKDKKNISLRIEKLSENPFHGDVAKLKGLRDAYRMRVGKYRILFRVVWEERGIIVFRIAIRGKVYET